MPTPIDVAARLLSHSTHAVALTGAGISTPSGIPDFRSPRSGLWHQRDPLQVASIWSYCEQPEEFYQWIRPVLAATMAAQPNRAHGVLAEMERRNLLRAVLTQNVDSLHQQAGSQRVIELHGHLRTATCLVCGDSVSAAPLLPEIVAAVHAPACLRCGGLLKPDVILYGEPLPYDALHASQQEALTCDLMLVVGTSLEVMPAADLPLLAKRRGARLVLINLTPTSLDDRFDVVVHGDVVKALKRIWATLDGSGVRN